MSTEESRRKGRDKMREYRERKRVQKAAAVVHEGLMKALVGPVDPAGELGKALAGLRSGLLATLGEHPSTDQESLVSMACTEKLLADSAAAYLTEMPVSAWRDPTVLAIVGEARHLRQSYRNTLIALRDPRLKPQRARLTPREIVMNLQAQRQATEAAQKPPQNLISAPGEEIA